MLHNRPKLQNLIQQKREEHGLAEYVTLLIEEYKERGDRTGHGAFHAAIDDRFGRELHSDPLAENRLLIERAVLKELLKRGHNATQLNESRQSALSRIQDDPCLAHLEKELHKLDENAHHTRQHRIHAARNHLHHLCHTRPERQVHKASAHDCVDFRTKLHRHEEEMARARAELSEAEAPCHGPQ